MSVPLDRLYNHLDGLCNHDVIIYRFFPYGSKKLKNIQPLKHLPNTWYKMITMPMMVCHDQEPLNIDFYSQDEFEQLPSVVVTPPGVKRIVGNALFRYVTNFPQNCFDKMLLCHSELNSVEVNKFADNGFIPIYWWSHAAIARDWYRYAELDPCLKVDFEKINKDFLIYNRDWSGTREYRLKFTELLIEQGLIQCSNVKFAPVSGETHYTKHNWHNNDLSISRCDLEHYIDENQSLPCASADYASEDYATTAIEVVLETLFDDSRHHLTEKALRPIACGRPFILATSAGGLEYLRRYGFQTFGEVIDESYDLITDPVQRLLAIVDLMKSISNLPLQEKEELWKKMYTIAEYNKKLFFSREWSNSIFQEFVNNTNIALHSLWKERNATIWNEIKQAWPNHDFYDPTGGVQYSPEMKTQFLQWLGSEIPVPQFKAVS